MYLFPFSLVNLFSRDGQDNDPDFWKQLGTDGFFFFFSLSLSLIILTYLPPSVSFRDKVTPADITKDTLWEKEIDEKSTVLFYFILFLFCFVCLYLFCLFVKLILKQNSDSFFQLYRLLESDELLGKNERGFELDRVGSFFYFYDLLLLLLLLLLLFLLFLLFSYQPTSQITNLTGAPGERLIQKMLDTNFCYVLDCPEGEGFAWVGKV